jgi:hypothetical protein
VTAAVWWDNGGQHWLAIHTGTDYCQVPPRLLTVCRAYNYHSGFGSVYPWVLLTMGGIFGFLIAHLRLWNCHETGCPRLGIYPVAGGAFRYCGKHHPDWQGKHPSREHIHLMHTRHKAAAKLADPAPRRR